MQSIRRQLFRGLVWLLAGELLFWAGFAQGNGSEKQLVAVHIDQEIVVDGRLDEPAWKLGPPATGFIQSEPNQGEPASEQTEVWVLFDENNLYIGAICHDSDVRAIVVNDLRKDFSTRDNDVFEVALDTFDDDRNGYLFGTNPEGARFDGQFGSEGSNFNRNWDGIWYNSVSRSEDNWQVEIVIPFRTLRFKVGEDRRWGINFLRRIRRKSEDSFWSPVPRPFRITKISYAGSMVGVRDVRQGRNLRVKPYLVAPISKLEGDDLDFKPDAGVDVKMGVSSELVLDLTVNTDFSQVEADEEQVNLTRFSLFFPEKREFFLENSSIFEFGRSQGPGGGGGDGGGRSRDLVPFFSRRIGISESNGIVPILGGARLTGRLGKYNLGMLTMQADSLGEDPSTNFSVVRVKRDILNRSEVGGLWVNKQDAEGGYNRTFGADANFTFHDYLTISSSLLKTQSADLSGEDTAGQVETEWDDNLWKMKGGFLSIGDNFNPEVGFAPRVGIRKTYGEFGYSPRPGERIPSIRAFQPSLKAEYITDTEGVLESRQTQAEFRILFQNGSDFTVSQENNFERLDQPFEIRNGQFIPMGDYNFDEFAVSYMSDRSRVVSGDAKYSRGSFYDGDRTGYNLGVRFQPNYKLRVETSWNHYNVELGSGNFDTDLARSRVFYSFSNRMFLNALIQYNSLAGEITSNIRFNFMYKPLSDFFLVYNERRSSTGEILDRAVIAKITYVFDF